MSSTPDSLERPGNPTQFGGDDLGDGLYESTGAEQDTSLRVQLGEHLDGMTRGSLQAIERSTNSVLEFARRNPLAIVAAVGGLALLVTALSRRSNRDHWDDRWY